MDRNDADLILLLAAAGPCSLDSSPGKNWVEKSGGLPNYICHIAKGIMRSGKSRGQAIAIAVSRVKAWAAGGTTNSRPGGKEVTAATRAKAAKAVAQWEALKAKNAARQVVKATRLDGSQYLVLAMSGSYSMDLVSHAWRAKQNAVEEAERQARGEHSESMSDSTAMEARVSPINWGYINEVWSDFVIVSYGDGRYVKVPYTVEDGQVDFGDPSSVHQEWVDSKNDEVDDEDTDLDDVERGLLADILQVSNEDKGFLDQIRAVVGRG